MIERKDATLHQTIIAEIEGHIASGVWPPGHRIPFEIELAKHYSCSRMTVNKALTQLARAGLIERRKRSGSFVKQQLGQSAVLEIQDIRKDVEHLKLPYAFLLQKCQQRPANAEDALRLNVDLGAMVLHVICVHMAAARPFCLEDRLIGLDSVPAAAQADFAAISPGQFLLRQVPWNSAEHRIQAIAATKGIAKSLELPEGTPCLQISRRTWSGLVPVTQVYLTYPGDRHSLVARFTPNS